MPNFSPQFLQKSPIGIRSQAQALEFRGIVACRIFMNRCQSGRIYLTFPHQVDLLARHMTAGDSALVVALAARQQNSHNVTNRLAFENAALRVSEIGCSQFDRLPQTPPGSTAFVRVSASALRRRLQFPSTLPR